MIENMLIKYLSVGSLESNCYILADEETKEARSIMRALKKSLFS